MTYKDNRNAIERNEFRILCQFCNKINRTKHLEFELLCGFCNKWAKLRYQKMRKTKIILKSMKRTIVVYKVVEKSVTCKICKELTPEKNTINSVCNKCKIAKVEIEV